MNKRFYYINNICDHDINVEGEILVILDENKKPIYHHDLSDSYIEFPEFIPRDFMREHKADYNSEYISIGGVEPKLAQEVEKYLESKGYSIELTLGERIEYAIKHFGWGYDGPWNRSTHSQEYVQTILDMSGVPRYKI